MQRYFAKDCIDNRFILNSDDYYHILTVMRMTNKDKVEIVFKNNLYLCNLDINGDDINVILNTKVEQDLNFGKEIILVLPLLKESKMDYILQKATELGASKIIPVVMERSIIKLDKSKEEKRINRWTKICKEASEQSKRLTIPVITEVKKWEDIVKLDGLKCLCSTKEKNNNIKMFLQSNRSYDKMIIVVGPEGGISPREEEYLNKNGFNSITLGNRIMRVETVPLFVLSIINYECME